MIDNTPILEAIKSARRDSMSDRLGVPLVAANNLMMSAWGDARETLKGIRDFKGSKALVSIPSLTLWETPSPERVEAFKAHLKTLLCVFDTVVLVPSPSGVSCHRYFLDELNYSGMSCRNAYLPHTFANLAFSILCSQPKLVEKGALTALPLLGDTTYRWSHPDLNIPEFSRPYSEQLSSNIELAEKEDFLDLATERLLAERLGGVHINGFSFDRPYIGDMRLPGEADVGKAILNVAIPGVHDLELSDLADLRADLAKEREAFSTRILDALRSDPRSAAEVTASLDAGSKRLNDEYSKCLQSSKALAGQILLKSTVFALSATGALGSASGIFAFLAGGGVLYDLRKLIVEWRDFNLSSRGDSLFFAGEIRRRSNVNSKGAESRNDG